jgi:CysZ protein
MLGFIPGFLAPFRGFARLAARPRLWPFAAIPVALNVGLCVGVAWAWFGLAEPALEARIADAAALGDGFFDSAARWLVRVLMFLAALPLLFGVFLALTGVVGGPFYEALCAATEAEALGRRDDPSVRNFFRVLVDGLAVEAGNLVVAVAGGVLALVMALAFPPFGAVPATALGWFLAGFGYLAYPFDRRARPLREKLAIVMRHWDVALGFGAATYLLLLPMVTAPLVAPCAVVGAALLFPGGERAGRSTGTLPKA